MGNSRTTQRRKHDTFPSLSSSLLTATRPFAPGDLSNASEHPKSFGHSIERMTIHRPEPEAIAENEAEHVAPTETSNPSPLQLASDTEALAEQDRSIQTARETAPLATSSASALQRVSVSAGDPVSPPPPVNRQAGIKRSSWSLERIAITRDHLSPVQRYATSISKTPEPSPQPEVLQQELVEPVVSKENTTSLPDQTSVPRTMEPSSQPEVLQQKPAEPATSKENTTGLPDHLKAGVESLSGLSLDDVHVHYNSSKPAEVDALAYTQGSEIHVGPGQEKHLAHEAWHVVQQKQRRVEPTLQAKGVVINDDVELEREADIIGRQALQLKRKQVLFSPQSGLLGTTQLTQLKEEDVSDRSRALPSLVDQPAQQAPIQRMKIKPPGTGDSQEVVFTTTEQRPMNGYYQDDGYMYYFILVDGEGVHYRRFRLSDKTVDWAGLENRPVYKYLESELRKNPHMTVSEVRSMGENYLLGSSGGDWEAIELFLENNYERVIRFENPPPLSQSTLADRSEWVGQQEGPGVWPDDLIIGAVAHMGGNKTGTRFVSTAQSEAALLTHGDSWVDNVTFGVNPSMKAPSISLYRVPRHALLTPEMVNDRRKVTGTSKMDLERSRMETEALYYGNDLSRYLISTRPNQYTPGDVSAWKYTLEDKKMQELEEEKVSKQLEEMKQQPPASIASLKPGIAKDDEFKKGLPLLLPLLGTEADDFSKEITSMFQRIQENKFISLKALDMKIIEQLESSNEKHREFADAWVGFTRPYRVGS